MNANSKRQFLGGAMALTVSTVLVKIIGVIYKIPLMHILGAEGMGYFNSAYEMYTLFFVISTAGIPIAISIMISECLAAGRIKNAERIYKTSLWLLVCVGTLGSLVMTFGADFIARSIGDEKASYALVSVAPTVLFISISGAVRGYFQGYGNMHPTAVSQVVESLGKLALGLLFALWAKGAGAVQEKTAGFAILGLTVGTAVSTLYLCLKKVKFRTAIEYTAITNDCDKRGYSLARLVRLAIPVTVSSLLVSVTRIVDMWVLMRRLPEGVEKLAVYGSYSTMALPIYNLPSSLVAGIALALVPSITAAARSGKGERENQLIASGFKLCTLVALPAALGIGIYSEQILNILFAGEQQAIAISAPLLSAISLSVLSCCLIQVCNSVLQAKGKTALPIFSMLIGVAIKVVFAYFLIGMPQIGAMGAPVSTLLCNITAVAIDLYFIEKYTAFETPLSRIFAKPFAASLVSAALSVLSYIIIGRYVSNQGAAFVVAAVIFAVAYGCCLVLLRVFDSDELELLPFGKRLYLVFNKKACGKRM